MKFHIVRNNETLEDILFLYNLTKDELMEQNQHIRVWNKIIPGTKLKIPPITDAVEQDISDMEPFVEDYYPKLNYKEYDITMEDDIPLETQAVSEIPDKQPELNIEENIKPTVENITSKSKDSDKPGYPPELLKKAKSEQKIQNQVYVVRYQSPYGYYGFSHIVPYQVVYYPIYQSKKSS
ncbi:MAG: LysM peptidoglycan-binding domain-containing protein [Bacilli bacterium]|nr:LysM peptidoglycan-binding domain-containing protein [Bacilli bacterium]MDD4076523.1 LysM peptidoglycan-binding domain-containing protein [Bacilli bacterium]MDD4387720.1 LysM peptidoglycan-binding domain-containing protein [Bacilli bacterium]